MKPLKRTFALWDDDDGTIEAEIARLEAQGISSDEIATVRWLREGEQISADDNNY